MSQVLVIDDHPIVLEGCRQLLKFAGIKRIVQTQSLADGFRLYRSKKPDLIIVDLAMRTGALGGLSFIRRLRLHDTRTPILVFSMHGDPVIVRRALDAGANGYLLKDTTPEDFLDALSTVRRGQPFLSHQLALQLAMPGEGHSQTPMTQRELQTLALIADGKAYAQIADDLGVSYKTVANTCSQLKAKLGASNLAGLVRMAIGYLSTVPTERGGRDL
jgi:DNA-binding NarL/FixJ family response regulator